MAAAYLAIDQGTTSSRAIVFGEDGTIIALAQQEFTQHYPQSGWVEHDAEEIWSTTLRVIVEARKEAEKAGADIRGIGITNQRETTIIWDRNTGEPIHRAIVWQDRRTAKTCRSLSLEGHEDTITGTSGLVIDPYFSASKIAWILDHVKGARARAEAGELAFGTVESFLIWRLTGGQKHLSDATNAARTSLFDIENGTWDAALCRIFNVPMAILPEVVDCAGNMGETTAEIGSPLPILAAIGDQQAAAVGQGCLDAGQIKSTFGTGCFVILNTGDMRLHSGNRLLSTVAYQIEGRRSYALEGSIFIAGAVVQWLRDGLGIIGTAQETEAMAAALSGNQALYMVPAFTGLGAPWWSPDARGAIYGITRDTGPAEMARAALESVAYQTSDLFGAMARDGVRPAMLKVDGGMAANNWLMQFLADILDMPVQRPKVLETTALGAAMLAALADGRFASLDDTRKQWQLDRDFTPSMTVSKRQELLSGWEEAVTRTRLGLA